MNLKRGCKMNKTYYKITYVNTALTGTKSVYEGLRSSDANEDTEAIPTKLYEYIEDSLQYRFRLLDENGNVLFRGYTDRKTKTPLLQIGTYFDVVEIEFRNPNTGEWR